MAKTAFAVFCATDGSLTFYNRDVAVPTAGDTFEGKTVSAVYTGWDTDRYLSSSSVPWYSNIASIVSVSFADEVAPNHTDNWLSDASNMTTFDSTRLDTSNVTGMSRMFYNCSSLTNLDVSSFDTSKVTSMANMFCYCSSLTNLDVSNFDTSKVTRMYSMFQNCSSLTNLDISSFDTSSVTDMKYMFYMCSKLETIYVSELWSIEAVTSSSSYMFTNCTKLVGAIPYSSSVTDATRANYETGYLTYKFYCVYTKDRFVLDGAELNAIAESVRKLTGSKDGMTPTQMVEALNNIIVTATDDGSGNVVIDMGGVTTTYMDGNVVIS